MKTKNDKKQKLNEDNYYSVSPYNIEQYKHLSYANASPDKRYIKILKWFYDNGESDKATCIGEVFKDNRIVADAWLTDNPRKALRGYAVTFFGQLVNDGLLNAKKKGKYTIFSLTDAGENLLRNCGAI